MVSMFNIDNLSNEERIKEIKSKLTDIAIQFYNPEKISDETRIGKQIWKDIKA